MPTHANRAMVGLVALTVGLSACGESDSNSAATGGEKLTLYNLKLRGE